MYHKLPIHICTCVLFFSNRWGDKGFTGLWNPGVDLPRDSDREVVVNSSSVVSLREVFRLVICDLLKRKLNCYNEVLFENNSWYW